MRLNRRDAIARMVGSSVALSFPAIAAAQGQPVIAPDVEETPTTIDTGQDRFDHMMAPVHINGQGPFQFLMDTGANASCISRALADRLSLQAGPTAEVHTMAGVRRRPSVVINRLEVGTRSRNTVHAPALPIQGSTIDGVLGVDWLKGQRLVLGFKTKTLEITKSQADREIDGQVIVPARRRMGQLTIVDADLSGQRISAMLDTGAQVSVCNAPLRQLVVAAEGRRGISSDPQRISMETIAGESFSGDLLYLPFLRLGGLHLGNVPVVHADVHVFDIWELTKSPAVVLGMDVLRQFDTVALDFGRSHVRFDLSAAPAPLA